MNIKFWLILTLSDELLVVKLSSESDRTKNLKMANLTSWKNYNMASKFNQEILANKNFIPRFMIFI